MMLRVARHSVLVVSVLAALSVACEPAKSAAPPVKKPAIDPKGPREVAILAGGCFWGMEKVMNEAPGVVDVEVGYAGGKATSASYEQVSGGKTGHAESVRIVFDPTKISYEDL